MNSENDSASEELDPLEAAREALNQVRRAARDRGLRPGVRPRQSGTQPGVAPRRDSLEPQPLGVGIEKLIEERAWQVDVQAGAVFSRWADIVGAEVASHCLPTTFEDSVLTVRAESTAWATQLRLLSSTLLAAIERQVGPEVVRELRIVGPGAPSWKHGYRGITGGRGPRDTYG
ncbi:DUF721 domain-containing protein [Branchiibius cervicis]|uniref:DUF721 domain-containing protein n=1 Tax=Branchiibius cervicis TaxID=908252 RepID=A0ABW2AX51_9MICO